MDRLGNRNIYKLNIYHTVNLMFRVKNNTIPETFQISENFTKISNSTT